MTTLALLTGFLTTWILFGLAAGIWMVRRGHDRTWIAIALALGPLFAPIAVERVERGSRLATPGSPQSPPARTAASARPRLLVGIDGSPAAQRALHTTLSLFGGHCELVILAQVVCYEASEDDHHRALNEASEHLAQLAKQLRQQGIPAYTEILAGPAAPTLGRFAHSQDVDAIVIGRQGRGLTSRLLGSVAADLAKHCTVPIVIVEPGQDVATLPQRPAADQTDDLPAGSSTPAHHLDLENP